MKTCTIWGDLSSDRTGEQYPTVAVCDDCVKAEQARGEDSQIVTVGDYDSDYGNVCEFCGEEFEDEEDEE